MKIVWNSAKEVLSVYGVYSSAKGPVFCVSPEKYAGLLVLGSSDVIVVDDTIGEDFVFYRFENGDFGVFCKILIHDRILDDLYELEPSAYKKFVDYLGHDP